MEVQLESTARAKRGHEPGVLGGTVLSLEVQCSLVSQWPGSLVGAAELAGAGERRVKRYSILLSSPGWSLRTYNTLCNLFQASLRWALSGQILSATQS